MTVPVLVDFTGDACTNCKWMKANMFVRPEVASVMKNMVLVELYTDRSDPLSESFQKLEAEQFNFWFCPTSNLDVSVS